MRSPFGKLRARAALARRITAPSVPSAGCGPARAAPDPPTRRGSCPSRTPGTPAGPLCLAANPLGFRPQAWGQPVGPSFAKASEGKPGRNRLRWFTCSHGHRAPQNRLSAILLP